MEISGLSYFNAYFQYANTDVNANNGVAFPKIEAIQSATEETKTNTVNADVRDIYQAESSGYSSFADVLSMQYKVEQMEAREDELAEAKVSNPQKYQRMLMEEKQSAAKSFQKVVEVAEENGNAGTYNGVPFTIDAEQKQMNVGDMSNGRIISVGLSNGWALNFDRDSIGSIGKMLDMFSAEDVNRIMNAIIKDNLAVSMEQEIENEEAEAATATANAAVNKENGVVDAAQNGMTAPLENENKNTSIKDVLPIGEVEDKENTTSATDTKTEDAKGEKEESEVTSQIVTNPDGSRQLVVTTKIGDMETVFNIKLSDNGEDAKKTEALRPEELRPEENSQLNVVNENTNNTVEQLKPTEFQSMRALNAYEANFMYAS